MRRSGTRIILIICAILLVFQGYGQEAVAPLGWNPLLFNMHKRTPPPRGSRTTAHILTLPFFENFTQYSMEPDSNKWVDNEVYVNNTMGASPVDWGVATFDALNSQGIPYDSFSNTDFRYCDSLTSQFIDLSTDSVGDSLYLSFFYQPQGNGYYPLTGDSLELYLKNSYGDFVQVWSAEGTTLQPFQQVMIPITDTLDFFNGFQFRFVNIAALYWADANWNIDYIRLDRNRSMNDTVVNAVGFTCNPSFMLNDYSFMPYNQFLANPYGELNSQATDSILNNSLTGQTVNYSSLAYDQGTGNILSADGPTAATISPASSVQAVEPLSIASFPTYPPYSSVVFENEYFLQTTLTPGPQDTIVLNQVFSNYLAYDDGSAEKSYYLNLSSSLPGYIAVEYHLNAPDTLSGVAIYFGRQVPFSSTKLFAIYVYSSLQGVEGEPTTNALDSTNLLIPGYVDSLNHFWNYSINPPLLLPAGTFYIGLLLPLGGQSDSLYFGLDVNRIGPNHLWYNVNNSWVPSAVSGALMLRPLLGHPVASTGVPEVHLTQGNWYVSPNPAKNVLKFNFDGDGTVNYQITDLQGQVLLHGSVANGGNADIAPLPSGMYFVNIFRNNIPATPQKFIKL